jgi:nitrate/nitrite-specific signal transduction histidine kinase
LRSGGHIPSSSGDIFLEPLSAKYLDKWNEISEKGRALNQYVGILGQGVAISAASNARIYSQNFVSMQTIFIIGAALVGCLILYIMNRLLRPISLIIKATEEVKKEI